MNVYPSQEGQRIASEEDFYILIMISIEAKLNCEWHITDLKLRLAQLKTCSELGADASASAEFINLLQRNLDSCEYRKKILAKHH